MSRNVRLFLWLCCRGAACLLVALLLASAGMSDWAVGAAKVIELSSTNRVGKLRVTLGMSETIRVSMPFTDIVIGDPLTADVAPLTDQTLYVLGRKLGTTNV